jgi:poly-gamma-glutamate synthesis protein (capsule biosynthesis protein)
MRLSEHLLLVLLYGSVLVLPAGSFAFLPSAAPASPPLGVTDVAPVDDPPAPISHRPLPDTTTPAWPERAPVPLDVDAARAAGLLDVRGVGDAGMALTYDQPPAPTDTLPTGRPARFGDRLDAFDPTGRSYRGDLSFINWESVVGTQCDHFPGEPGPLSYAFVSDPQNLLDARLRGFNLVGLANNHSQDCASAPDSVNGARRSAEWMRALRQGLSVDWLWHGVGARDLVRVRTLALGDRPVRVAFASLYLANKECPYVACGAARDAVLRSMNLARADLRILSLHSWNAATQRQLVETGEDFLRDYGGDIVFGHGPHVWRDVRIVESASGEPGVLFQSLGNFLHPELAAQRKNVIGRVLLDRETLRVRQVQAIAVAADGATASFADAPSPTLVPSNRDWTAVSDSIWRSGVSPYVRGAYFNVAPPRSSPSSTDDRDR